MEKKITEENKFKSYEEYKRNYFPIATNKQLVKFDSPGSFGINLARESLIKFQDMLVKQ